MQKRRKENLLLSWPKETSLIIMHCTGTGPNRRLITLGSHGIRGWGSGANPKFYREVDEHEAAGSSDGRIKFGVMLLGQLTLVSMPGVLSRLLLTLGSGYDQAGKLLRSIR